MNSLRLRLLGTIFCTMLVAWCAVVWVAYEKGRHEAEELMDGQLSLSARLLQAQIHYQPDHAPSPTTLSKGMDTNRPSQPLQVEILGADQRKPYEQELAFQIWNDKQVLILRSTNAESMHYSVSHGYSYVDFNGATWRMYVEPGEGETPQIQVAHPLQSRDTIGFDIAKQITIPLFLAFPFLLFTLFWAIQRSLQPLNTLTQEVRQRKSDQLDDIAAGDVPTELKPFVNAFNILLDRVRTSVLHERRFTSDAAHELRTPLAGIKIHAQLAAISQGDTARELALSHVMRGINRAEKLVEQMLRLARLDPEHGVLETNEQIAVNDLLREVQGAASLIARSKGQSVILLKPTGHPFIQGDHDLLLTALTNLVTNACRYSPSESQIAVGCREANNHWILYVYDHGPGIAADDLPYITQRFRRGSDVIEEGSGLGLTIVDRIASLHGATLNLINRPEGGLLAELVF